MRDDFLLRLAKYYYMVQTFNLIGGQNVSRHRRHFNPIHWNKQYHVFYLWAICSQIHLVCFSFSRIRKEQVCSPTHVDLSANRECMLNILCVKLKYHQKILQSI